MLRVDIFSFELKLKNSGAKLVAMLNELRSVRVERESILKDIKLFNYFFFNVFNDQEFKSSKMGGLLSKLPVSQIDKYVENPEQLFIVKEALAVYRKGSAGVASATLLCFEEDMCFDEVPQRFPGPFNDKLFINGPGFQFQVCPLTRREAISEPIHSIFTSSNINPEDSIFAKHNEHIKFTNRY